MYKILLRLMFHMTMVSIHDFVVLANIVYDRSLINIEFVKSNYELDKKYDKKL